ncbi:MAG TPA: hypothetical protein VFH03_24340 [Actinoplanes sp.]|nr:hypothetical protein [Actinoplanes sp.]
MTADFQVVPFGTRPDAGAHPATFVIEDGVPGLHQTADSPTPGSVATLRPDDLGAATVHQETVRP